MTDMNRHLIILATIAATVFATASVADAQQIAEGQVTVKNSSVKKVANTVTVNMDLDLSDLDLEANKGLVLTPMLVHDADTAEMPSAEILGRRRYIYYQRNGVTATTNPQIVERRYNGKEQSLHYTYSLPYQRWMSNSQLIMAEGACKCQQTLIDGVDRTLAGVNLFDNLNLKYAYVQPKAEEIKTREERGSAHLNFVVDKYDIRPTFGNNARELEKIRQTIDLVRNDKDVTLKQITLHGYASPDGRYSHNEKLAANRTKALRNYLTNYYSQIDPSIFATESTAEDWDSVRRAVANSDIDSREKVLKIIDDSSLTPDERDRKIANNYGTAYRTLINDIYPSVRRTDYVVQYNVRNFNLEEARRILKERPQKLSMQEMYLVANSYEKGSDDFCQVFDVAVRMFPDDELANLNAANVALSRGDLQNAQRFLDKAGDTPEATNACAILAAKQEAYATARTLFQQAAQAGLPEAQANLNMMGE